MNLLLGGRVERTVQHGNVAINADEALDLLPCAGRLVDSDRAVTDPFVLLGKTQIERPVGDGDPVLAKEDGKQTVEVAGDLERNGVMSAVPSGIPVVPTIVPPSLISSP
jgi:hypothetical protein